MMPGSDERQPLLASPSSRENAHDDDDDSESSTTTLEPARILGGTDSLSYNGGDVVVEVENWQALGRLFSSLLVDSIPGESLRPSLRVLAEALPKLFCRMYYRTPFRQSRSSLVVGWGPTSCPQPLSP